MTMLVFHHLVRFSWKCSVSVCCWYDMPTFANLANEKIIKVVGLVMNEPSDSVHFFPTLYVRFSKDFLLSNLCHLSLFHCLFSFYSVCHMTSQCRTFANRLYSQTYLPFLLPHPSQPYHFSIPHHSTGIQQLLVIFLMVHAY